MSDEAIPSSSDALPGDGDGRHLPVETPQARRRKDRPLTNLPLQQSSFVGRDREVAEIEKLVGGARLLTLYGPGGSGKTRLALAVAHEIVEGFEDGAWWVELAPLSDPRLVPGAVASALGVREAPDRPLTEALVEYLEPKEALLVLDNCEHLIEECATLADALLRACAGLVILATSREPLRVSGEATWPVPSLSLPNPTRRVSATELARYGAVRLFAERAGAVRQGFEVTEGNALAVARLCRQLDGIPLAIELAAARMRVLSVEQISDRLSDPLGLLTTGRRTAAPRHQTLRAALEWSYELLDDEERELLARLSVFVGGWDLEAAEAVGGEEQSEEKGWGEPVLDVLSRLVDKSLVVARVGKNDAPRYRLLEIVRQYAAEKLAASGEEAAVKQRHATYFRTLVERAEPELGGTEQVAWLDRLERDLGNLRAALSWLRESGQGLDHLRLAGPLWRFCYLRGHYEEGRGWLEEALTSGDSAPSDARAKAYLGAGALTFRLCMYERAREQLEAAVALFRTLGDDRGVASASHMLGSIANEQGRYARSEALHGDGLALWYKLGDEAGEAQALNYLGYLAWLQGKLERAEELGEETLARFRRLGDNEVTVWALINLGASALYAGDHGRARELLGESCALSEEVGFKEGVPWSLNLLGVLELREGDYRQATSVLRQSLVGHQDLGDQWRTASVLDVLAQTMNAAGHAEGAATLFGTADAVREAISVPVPLCERAARESSMRSTRAELGEGAFEAALSEGRAMLPLQAADYALGAAEIPHVASPATGPEPRRTPSVQEAGETEGRSDVSPKLRIFALGGASVERDGVALAPSQDWIHKPRELLFYLLSHPAGRTREQVGLDLWPEASSSQLRSSFHDAAFRLRRALGDKAWIVFRKGRYSFGRSLPYSYDVEAFERGLSMARRARDEDPEQAIHHLREATVVYAGDFLEGGSYGEWAVERQDELRREYGEALLLLGGLLSSAGRYADAAEAYRSAVAHDGFMEEAHRGLMQAHVALGERGRALKQYEELERLLADRLGASPAPETRELYESLR